MVHRVRGSRVSGALALVRDWAAGAEALAGRVPELAHQLAPGSWPLAVAVGACGLLLLLGGLRLSPLVTAAGGALLGWVAGGYAAPLFAGRIPPGLTAWVGAAALGVASLLTPYAFPAAAGALPGALLGARLFPWGALAGILLGAALLGLLAIALRRLVVALFAAAAGAALVAAALIALTVQMPALAVVTRRPTLLAALAATLAVAGAAFQLGRAPSLRRARESRRPPPEPPSPPRAP